METASTNSSLDDNTFLFNQLDSYPWDGDEEFQGGLRAILGSVQNPEQVGHLTLRAKCYYYARKAGAQVDFEAYKAHVEAQRHGLAPLDGTSQILAQPAPVGATVEDAGAGGMADAPKPASFADICALIAGGKPIPGIRDIPDTILEGRASESQAGKRKKPWETGGEAGEEKLSWMR